MTLDVPFDGFVAAAKRLANGQPTFVTPESGGTRVSCADTGKGIRVVAYSPKDLDPVAEELRKAGLDVTEGRWIPDDAPAASGDVYVAAIAYRTDSTQPGLWVDAFPQLPTSVQAITSMYEEFRETGQVAEVPLEEFVRLAEPTVVVLSPPELRGFAAGKDC
ncbi:hypothetical protein EON82_17970 [bacterium]|nr:MAG: hypothetical protein EON82_17970 [bacterium]